MKQVKQVMKVTTRPMASAISVAVALALAAAATTFGACAPVEETPDAGPDSGGGGVQATFTSLYGDYFATCKECHAPGAPGRTSDIEQTLNFSTKAMAYTTLKGMAAGLTGNRASCNGAKFIGATAATSLVLAVIDQPTRQAFDLAGSPNCDVDSITDATVKAGRQPSAAFVTALKTWLGAGAPNN
jgi:hypothetical protein